MTEYLIFVLAVDAFHCTIADLSLVDFEIISNLLCGLFIWLLLISTL